MRKPGEDSIVKQIIDVISGIDKVRKTAGRHHRSLSGDNYYGNKFDELRCILLQKKEVLEAEAKNKGNFALEQATNSLEPHFKSLINPDTHRKNRVRAKKQLLFVLHSQIEPFINTKRDRKTCTTEKVIPMSIIRGTRGYIEKVAMQANGCYESGWFDACAVMIRRVIETLIIECFEHFKIAEKIKDCNGNFFFLRELIDACLKESAWTLGRNTKKALPNMKDVGDLSAHNRRYLANKMDIDRILQGIRLTIEELVYVSGLKK